MHRINVVLITIDCLRKDHLGCYGYGKKTSPFIDSLARKSFVFDRAYSIGPNTPHSFPGLFTSNYCLVNKKFSIEGSEYTLATIFKENGYHAIAFNASNPWVSSYQGYNRGFDDFFEFEDLCHAANNFKEVLSDKKTESVEKKIKDLYSKIPLVEKIIYSRRYIYEIFHTLMDSKIPKYILVKNKLRKEFFEKIEKIIYAHNLQPFFLWIHSMDVHDPYCPPRKNQENLGFNYSSYTMNHLARRKRSTLLRMSKRKLKKLINLYDGEINFVDQQLKRIFHILKSKFGEDILIILTSDHGESFYDHNTLEHCSILYDELINIPLIIHLPKQSRQIYVKELVSQMDLLPTIADCIGLGIKPMISKKIRGRSFSNLLVGNTSESNGKLVFSEAAYDQNDNISGLNPSNLAGKNKRYAAIGRKWKLIWDRGKNVYELYDLQNDLQEKHNLAEQHPNVVKLLHRRIIEEKQKSESEYLVSKLSQIRSLIQNEKDFSNSS